MRGSDLIETGFALTPTKIIQVVAVAVAILCALFPSFRALVVDAWQWFVLDKAAGFVEHFQPMIDRLTEISVPTPPPGG